MTRYSLLVLILALPAAAAEPAVERMKADLLFLAGEECRGRGTGSPGLDKAADHVAAQFKAAGLKPGGAGGSYFQPFSFPYGTTTVGAPTTLRLTGPKEQAIELKQTAEFVPVGASAAGTAAAELVFAGFGISAPDLKYDDYAGLNVRGKIVVALRRTPNAEAKDNPFEKDDAAQHAGLATKARLAAKNGAVGLIVVNDRSYGKDDDPLSEFRRSGGAADIPVAHMKRTALDHILVAAHDKTLAAVEAGINKDVSPRSLPLTGWSAKLQVSLTRPVLQAKNVVGVLDGSGPLANETVVVGAHYDHVGLNEFDNSAGGRAAKGKVHYGADDNASGTTGLIELARRFGAAVRGGEGEKGREGEKNGTAVGSPSPPVPLSPSGPGGRRRLVFVAFAAEELGLFGSKEYCDRPPVPLDTTVFMLNMDMIGRLPATDETASRKKDTLQVWGTGTAEGLDKLVDEFNEPFAFKLTKITGGTGPSDHQSFFLKKIPVLFLFTGVHPDYHRPTDTPDKINLDGMARVAGYAEKFLAHYATAARPKFVAAGSPATAGRSGPKGPRLGLMPGNYQDESGGVLVDGVTPGGPAEKGGVQAGDVIVQIGGKPVTNITTYMTVMGEQKAGTAVEVVVVRKKDKVTLTVTPGN